MNEEGNGNVLRYKVNELFEWKKRQEKLYANTISPFVEDTKRIINFVDDYCEDIKDLNVMKNSIERIEKKMSRVESFQWKVVILLIGTLIGTITSLIVKFAGG